MKQAKRHRIIKTLAEFPMNGLNLVELSFGNEEFEATKQTTVKSEHWESKITIRFN